MDNAQGRQQDVVAGAAWNDARARRAHASEVTDPELLALLERAKGYKMTAEERREQRISFVYGNVAFDNPTITREQVAAIVDGLDLPPREKDYGI